MFFMVPNRKISELDNVAALEISKPWASKIIRLTVCTLRVTERILSGNKETRYRSFGA